MKPRTRPFPNGECIEKYVLESGDKIIFSKKSDGLGYNICGICCNDLLTKIVPLNFGRVREVPANERFKVRSELWNYFKEQNPDTSVNYRDFGVRFLPFID